MQTDAQTETEAEVVIKMLIWLERKKENVPKIWAEIVSQLRSTIDFSTFHTQRKCQDRKKEENEKSETPIASLLITHQNFKTEEYSHQIQFKGKPHLTGYQSMS